MRKIWIKGKWKKSFGFGKKLDFGFGSWYQNLVLVPDTETWFQSFTSLFTCYATYTARQFQSAIHYIRRQILELPDQITVALVADL